MTMPQPNALLFSFRSKVEEAISLVSEMVAADKLKSVQFWNIVSDKLQDIVNKSVDDISAVSEVKEESDSDKLNIEVLSTTDNVDTQTSTSDLLNIPLNCTVYSDAGTQFHYGDLKNTYLKHLFPTKKAYPSNEQFASNESTYVPHIHHLNPVVDISTKDICAPPLVTAEGCNTSSDTLITDTHLTSETSTENVYKDDDTLKPEVSQSPLKCHTHLQSSRHVKKRHLDESDISDIDSPDIPPVFKKSTVKSKRLFSKIKKKVKSKSLSDSEDSFTGSRSDLDPTSALDESMEEYTEHVSFVVSNSEEVLENNEVQSLKEKRKKKYLSYRCKICHKHFSSTTTINHHMLIHKKTVVCEVCEAVFATNGNLAIHMRKHTGEKPYACHQCSASFSTQGNLKRHVQTHTGVKPWKCDECDSYFTEKKSLTIHMRRHTGERPYECKICGKAFAQTGVLTSHMALHLDVKVHLCEICGKSFRQKAQLRIHRIRHENLRRFKCDTCSSDFLTKCDLERHVRTHTGEKPFACDMCNKSFTRQQSLNEHVNRHLGIKPYRCKHCGRKFVEMPAYYKHLKCHGIGKKEDDCNRNKTDSQIKEEPQSKPCTPVTEAGNTENVLPNAEEGTEYIAVVVNSKGEVQNVNSQTIVYNPEIEENGIVSNNFGVLTAINLFSNASIMPTGFLS